MIRLYQYSPARLSPIAPLEGLDGSQQDDLLRAFALVDTDAFIITEEQLGQMTALLQAEQPEDTVWGLDPTEASLIHLGQHPGVDPTNLWLEIRPPFTLSHAQARHLFGMG